MFISRNNKISAGSQGAQKKFIVRRIFLDYDFRVIRNLVVSIYIKKFLNDSLSLYQREIERDFLLALWK